MKSIVLNACLVAAVSSFAALPEVVSVGYEQEPKSRLVTVTYELANGPAIVTMEVLTNGAPIAAQFLTNATGDVNCVVESGSARQIFWPAREAWPDRRIRNGQAQVRLTAWPTNHPPAYMVVDLAAENRDVTRYYVSTSALPHAVVGGDVTYRTTKLLLRRIRAKDVQWQRGYSYYTGSTGGNGEHYPQPFTVALDADYWIGVFPITVYQWRLLTTEEARDSAAADTAPAVKLSYNNIRDCAYNVHNNPAANWPSPPAADSGLGLLRARTQLAFELPSEAQWEFAWYGGHAESQWGDGSLIYPPISATSSPVGWMNNEASTVQPCGLKKPNDYGLYDMVGNSMEWVLDWYEQEPSATGAKLNIDPADGAKTLTGATGSLRIVKGGNYHSKLWDTVPYFRCGWYAHLPYDNGGNLYLGSFRVVLP